MVEEVSILIVEEAEGSGGEAVFGGVACGGGAAFGRFGAGAEAAVSGVVNRLGA
ncbi:hypothetical protein WDZ92_13230 [Nostoc sp. NIES-2111]